MSFVELSAILCTLSPAVLEQAGKGTVLLPCSEVQCLVWRRSRALISASRVVLAKTIRHMPANSQ